MNYITLDIVVNNDILTTDLTMKVPINDYKYNE